MTSETPVERRAAPTIHLNHPSTPSGYYLYLRGMGYKHSTAYNSVLMRFCKSGDDLNRRLTRIDPASWEIRRWFAERFTTT